MTSPSRAAALTSELKEEVERRLKITHEDRIAQLTQSLHNSLLSPFDRATVNTVPATKAVQQTSGQPRIADVFDELIRTDRANRVQQLADEVAFRDQELTKLRERLEKTQLEASLNKEQRDVLQHQLAKATSSSQLLEQELRRLQKEHETLGQEVQSLQSGKSTAERTSAIEQARATAAEQLAASRGRELDNLKADYKQLLAEQQQQQTTTQKELQDLLAEATKQRSLASQQEEQLSKELSNASKNLLEVRGALAAEKATNESLEAKLAAANESLADLKKQKKQLASNLNELEGLLAESERERKDARNKYMKLGEDKPELCSRDCWSCVCW
jgi:chromosome segregation ATPase